MLPPNNKVFEKLLYDRLYSHLEHSGLLTAVAILRGGLGGPWPAQNFAWPPSFFLISRSSF